MKRRHWAVWSLDSEGVADWYVQDFVTKAEAINYCKAQGDASLDLGVVNMRPVARFKGRGKRC